MIPPYPRATIAIFLKDAKGNLEFKGTRQDSNYLDYSNVKGYPNFYNNLAKGDSGGPTAREFMEKNEKRYVILAVLSKIHYLAENTDEGSKCKSTVSKITKEVVQWIKELHSKHENS